jgi:hypothetical protein
LSKAFFGIKGSLYIGLSHIFPRSAKLIGFHS